MGNRYSKAELEQIASLVDEGLTNREISVQLCRSEAGIRNIRYRLNLKREAKDNIRSLRSQKEELEAQIQKLNRSIIDLSGEVRSLEEKKARIEKVLAMEEKLMKTRIETQLISLKIEKPELFYISGAEQIGKLVGEIFGLSLKWLLS